MSKLEVDKIDPQSGTDLELGTSGDTITIPTGVTLDASNATTTLPANVVTTDGSQTLTNKSIDASQLTGTITPSDGTVTNAKIVDSTIQLAKLSATGTKDATTFLRGDNTFAEAGGGKVLQVVTLSNNTSYSQSGTGTTDCTNYNISITPSSASSKVMIIMSINHYVADSPGTSDAYARGEAYIRDVTNGTDLADLSDLGYYIGSGSSYEQTLFTTASRTILHSPNTTSSITYSVRLEAPTANNLSNSSDFIGILMEIGA